VNAVNLVGNWVVDETDGPAIAALGNVHLAFESDGRLTYTVREGTKKQIINLRYTVEGTTIITDQPSDPRIERTPFSISADGLLTLTFDGVSSRFRRAG
jgi:hypothetical protein